MKGDEKCHAERVDFETNTNSDKRSKKTEGKKRGKQTYGKWRRPL